MSTAFIYPGQGSQYVGMGESLYESYSEIKDLYTKANEILGFDIIKISFEGPDELLKQTYITQPAIFVHSIAVTSIVKRKIDASSAAGHSLGEYSALVYSGAINFENGLNLVKIRGESMQEAGEHLKGTMAAIIGLDNDKTEKICEQASEFGVVQVANYNSPRQIVISGTVEGVKKAMELAYENKAKFVKQLVVHGAFHSSLMESAKEKLKSALDSTIINKVGTPVYMNVDAKPITQNTGVNEIKKLLYKQLTSSVRWEETVTNMINDGVNDFIELGPGRVLQGLVKRINNNVKVRGFEKTDDLKEL
ncbi:MAG: ACP S-malonyltransferase [Ignavibacteria bacterium]